MQRSTDEDPRTDNMKIEMAQHFDRFEAEYHDGSWSEIVYEDDDVVVVADHKGFEFDEWCDDYSSVDRDELSEFFHSTAQSLMDTQDAHDHFATAYPVVFDKLE